MRPAAHNNVPLNVVPHQIVATWPVGTFLENIALFGDGSFAVTVHNGRRVDRVLTTGEVTVLAELPTSPAGIIADRDGLWIVGGEPGAGPHVLFHLDGDSVVTERGPIPDTLFLNGFTPGRNGFGYAVDSIMGVVIEIDLAAATSRVVLADDRLTKCSDEPMLPGANGIKAGDDALWITNTDRALILRATLGPDGPTGELTTFAEHLRGDDLALDVNGALYITNHIHNTLIRLRPDGKRIAIAGPAQGMAGCTACAFGSGDEAHMLFVTTTGGIVMPLDGIVQEAKLVRLDVGVGGRRVDFR